MKTNIVIEMMEQRGYKIDSLKNNCFIGVDDNKNYIYVKIFENKLELNVVREFISNKFIIENNNITMKKSLMNVTQLVIICKSYQNSHVKEFKEISSFIQLIREDFFNINITKIAPKHFKVDSIIKNKSEIAIIKQDDAICIFYNFQKGDIIQIIRSDGDIHYRMVK